MDLHQALAAEIVRAKGEARAAQDGDLAYHVGYVRGLEQAQRIIEDQRGQT